MTLEQANSNLLQVDCNDLDAVATALTDRARAIAQFASTADRKVLDASLAAGNEFLDRLDLAHLEASRELDNLRKLKRGLLDNVTHSADQDQVVCFG